MLGTDMVNKGRTPALFTDLYQITMAQAYWQSGTTAEATFSLFIRNYPPDRAYFVLAGVQDVLDHLEDFRFAEDEIDFLRSLHRFEGGFLDILRDMHFTGSVRAMPEGAIFFANEPVVEVTAPVIEGQLIETFLINQINMQSLLATKASRVVYAARGRTVLDFAARRTHGIDAADKLSRAAYIVGFAGTSNVLASKRYGIPTFGTMAHSFVTCFPSEIDAFRAYADSFPDTTTLLVDTYDTLGGVRNAINVAKEMQRRGHTLRSIRLDSGDMLDLSLRSRALLDEAGLTDVQVFASGGLDEFEVDTLLSEGAQIDGFGVGTRVGVSDDAPWTDCAYKLVEYGGRPTIKLSAGKVSLPGRKQVTRVRDETRSYVRDVVALADEEAPGGRWEPLLSQVMKEGSRLEPRQSIEGLRERFKKEFDCLPDQHKALRSPATYDVSVSGELQSLSESLSRKARGR